MKFDIQFTDRANRDYFRLRDDPSKVGVFRQVNKVLDYLKINPRHPSLNTHKYEELSRHYNREIFEAYVQQNALSAYRIFFYYSGKRQIIIIAITPHP